MSIRAEFYLVYKQEISLSKTPPPFDSAVLKRVEDKIAQFLLALNISGKLWRIDRVSQFGWFDAFDAGELSYALSIGPLFLASADEALNLDDFKTAAELSEKIDMIYGSNINEYPAIRVALDALNVAVTSGTISLRFIENVLAVEALCSRASSEVQHRIGTSGAKLLRATLEERRLLYAKVVKLYGVRSRVVHGSGKEVSVQELREIEQISRPLLLKILSDDILPSYRTAPLQKDFLLNLVLR